MYCLENADGQVTDISLTQPVAEDGQTVVEVTNRTALSTADTNRPHHFTIADGVLSVVYEDE